jgi:hypothetical protein
MEGKAKIFARECANFSREILEQMGDRIVLNPNGDDFCLGYVNYETRAIPKEI